MRLKIEVEVDGVAFGPAEVAREIAASVEAGKTKAEVEEKFGVDRKTLDAWLRALRGAGLLEPGVRFKSGRPLAIEAGPQASEREREIVALAAEVGAAKAAHKLGISPQRVYAAIKDAQREKVDCGKRGPKKKSVDSQEVTS